MPTAQTIGFSDPYNFDPGTYQDNFSAENGYMNTTGPTAWFHRFFGRDVNAERDYGLAQIDREYERASIESARAWSEYMDNTQTQRRVKDIEAAGLNPWLAVQNGIAGSCAE